ncbi:hypothetical protein B0T24DRAFT_414403 [Lasiosphaeria ovina]|uniref:Uncharacterized protein n=1 Tax=Lasiosphaeria ovina TaxID=92902 RepID=A0AAE0JXK8_9PEZI|nr:hypothetical protein B0T24DRAFT_414403 [Lasiosphaeria ovina]
MEGFGSRTRQEASFLCMTGGGSTGFLSSLYATIICFGGHYNNTLDMAIYLQERVEDLAYTILGKPEWDDLETRPPSPSRSWEQFGQRDFRVWRRAAAASRSQQYQSSLCLFSSYDQDDIMQHYSRVAPRYPVAGRRAIQKRLAVCVFVVWCRNADINTLILKPIICNRKQHPTPRTKC